MWQSAVRYSVVSLSLDWQLALLQMVVLGQSAVSATVGVVAVGDVAVGDVTLCGDTLCDVAVGGLALCVVADGGQ